MSPSEISRNSLIVGAITFAVVLLIGLSMMLFFKKRKFNRIRKAPVVVTSTHATAAGYPTTVEPTPSGGYQAAPYPTAMPMPMVQPGVGVQPYPLHPGFQPHTTPYPPEIPPSQVNPPSYDQVVAAESYAKQAPYNPSYPAPGH